MYSFGLHCLRPRRLATVTKSFHPASALGGAQSIASSNLLLLRDLAHLGMIGSQPHTRALLRELLG